MALFQTRDNLLVGTFPRNVRDFMARRTRRGRVPAERVRTFLAAAIAVALFAVASGEGAANGAKRLVIGDPPPHKTGAFRPFAIPGKIDVADGFIELRQGRSMTVWCPESVEREKPDKVAAARRFIDSPFLPVGSVSVAYFGDAGGAQALESLGVRFTKHDARRLPPSAQTQLVVVGPGAEHGPQTPEQKRSFQEWLSSRTVVVLPGADLSLLPFGLSSGRAPLRAEEASVPDLPVFAGIQRDFEEFLRLCAGRETDVVEGGPAWLLSARPACFAHLKTGSMSAIVLTVAPGDVPEPARAALSRIWCTILANLNVETPFRQ